MVQQANSSVLASFVEAAHALVAQGAAMLSTSCGLLATYQSHLATQVALPVLTFGLLQCTWVQALGIVTIDAAALTAPILREAGVPLGTPVQGVAPGCEFRRRLLGNEPQLDTQEAERNVVAAA